MKKFKAAAIMLSLLLVGAVGCTNTPPDETGNPGTDEGWQGNWTRPDVPPDDDTPEVHECTHSCYVCGKCLTNCVEEVCAEKCFEPHGRTQYTFSGTDENVIKRGGVNVNPDGYLGNVNANAEAQIVYCVEAEEETTVCLGVTISEQPWESAVTVSTPIFINGEQFFSRGYLPAGNSMWTTFYTVWLGCVKLEAGVNEIMLTGTDGNAYNFKDFTFLSDTELTLVEQGGLHKCSSKNEAGKCTDYTCNETVCMDKDETGWQSVELGAGDDRILKYGTKNGEEISLWNAEENCIGQIANGSIVGISDQTVAFSFEVSEETFVRISLSTGTQLTAGLAVADMWTLTFNGYEVTTGAVNQTTDNPGWGNYLVNNVIYLKAQAGRNDFVMVHKNTNAGDNINKVILGYEKGTVSFVQASKPGADKSVTGVSLAAEGGVTTVNVGETLQLTATVSPSYAENKNVTFSSSDENVATVNESGLVTAVGGGTVTITVTTEDGNKVATLDLTAIIPVESVTLTAENGATELTETETLQLTATVLPDNASNKKVTYSTSDKTVATVSESGLVTAIAAGTVTITATSEQGGKTATLELTVNERDDRIAVTGVTLATAGDATSLKKGETLQLTATVAPENATNKIVSYTSSDESVATVGESGLVTAVGGGTVTITVTAEGAHTDTVTLTVTADVTDITVTSDSADGTMINGDTLNLTATVAPADATVGAVEWKVTLNGEEVNDILTPDGNDATFTPTQNGTYVITATAKDGSGVCGEYIVTVINAPYIFKGSEAARTDGNLGSIKLEADGTLGNINENRNATLTYTLVAAADCTAELYLRLAFGSPDVENIFTLTVNGEDVDVVNKFHQDNFGWSNFYEYRFAEVELKAGINTIVLTVTGACGNFDYMALKCGTEITPPSVVTAIMLVADLDGMVFVGDTVNLTATVLPETAADRSIEWEVTLNGTAVENVLTTKEGGATFTPAQKGTYVITATAKDGSGVSGSYSVTVLDTPVTGEDHIFYGKDALINGDGITVQNDGTLGGINENKGATLTYKVDAAADCTAGLYLNLAFGWGGNAENIFTITVNGENVEVVNKFHQDGSNWSTYTEFWFANVELNAGTNTIVLTVTGACGNYDYMTLKCDTTEIKAPGVVTAITLVADSNGTVFVGDTLNITATVAPADATVSAVEWKVTLNGEEVNDILTTKESGATFTPAQKGTYVITATAKDGSGVSGSYSVTVLDTPVTGADHIFYGKDALINGDGITVQNDGTLGGINENKGATLTYKVDAAADCTAGLYLNLAFGWGGNAENIFTITVNGENVEVVNKFHQDGSNWSTYTEFWFANVELNAGTNTIVLTVTGACGNYDYMTLKCDTTEIKAPNAETTTI